MNGSHFDDVLRALAYSRRSLLIGAPTAGFFGVSTIDAKKRRHKSKKRKAKATPNEFGCFEVGDPCTSEDDCCSGICEGRKGRRQCRAHDTGTCEQGVPGLCEAGNPTDTYCNGGYGFCVRTTAGSNACIYDRACADCQRDADCAALGYPPGSACAQWGDAACDAYPCATSTACVLPAPEA